MLFKRYTNAEFTNLYLEYDPASTYDSINSVDESFVQAMLEDEKALDLFIKRYWVERFRVYLISDNSNILIFYKTYLLYHQYDWTQFILKQDEVYKLVSHGSSYYIQYNKSSTDALIELVERKDINTNIFNTIYELFDELGLNQKPIVEAQSIIISYLSDYVFISWWVYKIENNSINPHGNSIYLIQKKDKTIGDLNNILELKKREEYKKWAIEMFRAMKTDNSNEFYTIAAHALFQQVQQMWATWDIDLCRKLFDPSVTGWKLNSIYNISSFFRNINITPKKFMQWMKVFKTEWMNAFVTTTPF